MTERLKTLKYFIGENYKVDYDELKAEAVKWVKHFRKEYGEEYCMIEFETFFNITEADLKEGVGK